MPNDISSVRELVEKTTDYLNLIGLILGLVSFVFMTPLLARKDWVEKVEQFFGKIVQLIPLVLMSGVAVVALVAAWVIHALDPESAARVRNLGPIERSFVNVGAIVIFAVIVCLLVRKRITLFAKVKIVNPLS